MPALELTTLPDPELIELCLAHNAVAWETLIARYQRLIYSIPLRYGLSPTDAADVFQNVCVLLLENLAFLRNRQRLGAWLITTTRRECWKLARQAKAAGTATDLEVLETYSAPDSHEEDFAQLEHQTIIHAAVDHLGERCRRLLALLFYTEPRPSYAEIMQSLGLPSGSIGPTRARCLEKLLENLEKEGFF